MLDLFFNIFGVLFLTISGIYIWSNLLDKKVNFKDYKLYILTIILFVITFLNYNSVLKFTMMTIVVGIFAKIIFKVPFKYGLITVFFTQTVGIILELIFGFSFIYILNINITTGKINYAIAFFADLFISIADILIFRIKFIY